MTPEHFCWLYAVGCLEARHTDGTLTKNEYDEAVMLVQKNELPTKVQVRLWFPRPFEILEKDCGNGKCTLSEMKKYWREKHRNKGEQTPVKRCRILSMPKKGLVLLRNLDHHGSEIELVNAINVHNFSLSVMDDVFVHAGIIAERCPQK